MEVAQDMAIEISHRLDTLPAHCVSDPIHASNAVQIRLELLGTPSVPACVEAGALLLDGPVVVDLVGLWIWHGVGGAEEDQEGEGEDEVEEAHGGGVCCLSFGKAAGLGQIREDLSGGGGK